MNIHQIWIDSEIPEREFEWMKTWQNIPGTTYKLWSDEDCKIYEQDLIAAEIETLHPSFKTDLIRLRILQDHGGLYLDCDCEKIGDIPEFSEFSVALFEKDSKSIADNFFIFAPQGEPLLQNIIDFGMNFGAHRSVLERFSLSVMNHFWGTSKSVSSNGWCIHHETRAWKSYPQTKYTRAYVQEQYKKLGLR